MKIDFLPGIDLWDFLDKHRGSYVVVIFSGVRLNVPCSGSVLISLLSIEAWSLTVSDVSRPDFCYEVTVI